MCKTFHFELLYFIFNLYFCRLQSITQFKLSNMFIACEAYYEEMKKLHKIIYTSNFLVQIGQI